MKSEKSLIRIIRVDDSAFTIKLEIRDTFKNLLEKLGARLFEEFDADIFLKEFHLIAHTTGKIFKNDESVEDNLKYLGLVDNMPACILHRSCFLSIHPEDTAINYHLFIYCLRDMEKQNKFIKMILTKDQLATLAALRLHYDYGDLEVGNWKLATMTKNRVLRKPLLGEKIDKIILDIKKIHEEWSKLVGMEKSQALITFLELANSTFHGFTFFECKIVMQEKRFFKIVGVSLNGIAFFPQKKKTNDILGLNKIQDWVIKQINKKNSLIKTKFSFKIDYEEESSKI